VYRYEDATRGIFQSERKVSQLVSFEGMKYVGVTGKTNVTPTDIDGFIQLEREGCFIIFELKHSGGLPIGQRKALEKLSDSLGQENIVLVAIHNTPIPQKIIAKDAIVDEYYYKGKWRTTKYNETLGDRVNEFIEFVRKKNVQDKTLYLKR